MWYCPLADKIVSFGRDGIVRLFYIYIGLEQFNKLMTDVGAKFLTNEVGIYESANLENTAVATGLEKGQFSFQFQRKATPKNAQTTAQLHSSHTLIMFKIVQARLQQYVNRELPDSQAGFRKGRGTRDQIANIRWIIKK